MLSIGMPVCNCEDTIRFALESLVSQTWNDWELIVLDDGSTDQTLKIIRQYNDPRIFLVADGKKMGLPARLNQTISLSRGKYFARMDGDDIAYPQRFEKQITYLHRNTDVDLVGSAVVVFDDKGNPLGKRYDVEHHNQVCERPHAGFPMAHPTYLGYLEWFKKYYYNARLKKAQDQDLLLRSYRYSRFANVPEIQLGYREERLNLKKILLSRWYFSRALVKEFFGQQHSVSRTIQAVAGQAAKGCVDTIAVFTRLHYHLLRHRARPLSAEEKLTWCQLWDRICNEPLRVK